MLVYTDKTVAFSWASGHSVLHSASNQKSYEIETSFLLVVLSTVFNAPKNIYLLRMALQSLQMGVLGSCFCVLFGVDCVRIDRWLDRKTLHTTSRTLVMRLEFCFVFHSAGC